MATSTRSKWTAPIAAGLGALALVSAMVMRTSQATFTASTENTGNSFATGDLVLTDDDGAVAMFTVTGMEPGQSATDCITVTYGGSISDPSAVKLYRAGTVTESAAGIGDQLNLTIEETATCGVAGTGIYSGTVNGFVSSHTDYATGAGTWDPTPSDTQIYQFTVELDASTGDTYQGESLTGLGFIWEIQN